jgi:predicted site-specific integrase-resolvase
MSLEPSQAAKILECTPFGIRKLLRKGRLKGKKDSNGKWSIEPSDLEAYIQRKAFTVHEWAAKTGYHPETIRRWLRNNIIPGQKDGQWIVATGMVRKLKKKKRK